MWFGTEENRCGVRFEVGVELLLVVVGNVLERFFFFLSVWAGCAVPLRVRIWVRMCVWAGTLWVFVFGVVVEIGGTGVFSAQFQCSGVSNDTGSAVECVGDFRLEVF